MNQIDATSAIVAEPVVHLDGTTRRHPADVDIADRDSSRGVQPDSSSRSLDLDIGEPHEQRVRAGRYYRQGECAAIVEVGAVRARWPAQPDLRRPERADHLSGDLPSVVDRADAQIKGALAVAEQQVTAIVGRAIIRRVTDRGVGDSIGGYAAGASASDAPVCDCGVIDRFASRTAIAGMREPVRNRRHCSILR